MTRIKIQYLAPSPEWLHLLKTVASLVNDIEGMQSGTSPDWFGEFSRSQKQDDGSMAIEWPNLAISVEEVVNAIKALPSNRGITEDIRIHGSERDLDWNDQPRFPGFFSD